MLSDRAASRVEEVVNEGQHLVLHVEVLDLDVDREVDASHRDVVKAQRPITDLFAADAICGACLSQRRTLRQAPGTARSWPRRSRRWRGGRSASGTSLVELATR